MSEIPTYPNEVDDRDTIAVLRATLATAVAEIARVRVICFEVRDILIATADSRDWRLACLLNYACGEVQDVTPIDTSKVLP